MTRSQQKAQRQQRQADLLREAAAVWGQKRAEEIVKDHGYKYLSDVLKTHYRYVTQKTLPEKIREISQGSQFSEEKGEYIAQVCENSGSLRITKKQEDDCLKYCRAFIPDSEQLFGVTSKGSWAPKADVMKACAILGATPHVYTYRAARWRIQPYLRTKCGNGNTITWMNGAIG